MHSNTGFHEHTRDDDLSNRSLVAVNEATTTTKSGRNKMRLVATFVLMSFGILYWISVAGDAQDISYVLVLQQQQPEPQSSRRKDNNAVLSAPHNDRQLETQSVTSAPTTAARYTPALRYIQHLNTSCIMRLQHAVSKWMSCVDGSVSAAAGSSRWSKHNPCGFIDIPSFHDPLVTGLMMSHVLEAHGDSTLRELLKLMIGGLKMEGTLDKKDASAALRAPKYFMRWLGRPNETQHVNAFRDVRERKRSTGGSLLHRHRCFGEIVESALTSIHTTTSSSGLVVDDSGGAPPLLPYRHNFNGGAAAASSIASPLALRFMFRFDFVPVSFFEQLNGTIPLLQPPANSTESTSVECQELAAAGGSVTMHKPTSFFDGDAAQRIILLATGSHTAKIIASNQSAQVYSRRLVTEPAFAVDELFRLVIMDTEDYIIRRLLGLIVVRNPTTREPVSLQRLLPASMKSSSTVNIDAAVAPADAIIIFEEDLECESMNEAKLQGFRDMALQCPLMRTLLQRINELLRIHFTFSSLTSGDVGAMHRHSALKQLLTKDQRLTVGQRVIYVPLLDCHGGGKFQYTPSKPYCTRDGIHLRTKFIRKKVSVLLNVLLGLAKCSA